MDIPICCATLPSCSQRRSLHPEASAANKRVVDFLVSVVNPELVLAGGAGTAGGTRIQYCCKPCFSELERAERSLEAAKCIINELRSKFSLPPVTELFQQIDECPDDEKHTSRSRTSIPLERFTPCSPRKSPRVEDSHRYTIVFFYSSHRAFDTSIVR